MRIITLTLTSILFLGSCNSLDSKNQERTNQTHSKNTIKKDSVMKDRNDFKPEIKDSKSETDVTLNDNIDLDFLSDCDSLEIWHGGIQGTTRDDLTCCYLIAQCQTNRHFDLIVYHESQSELEDAVDYKNNRIKQGLKNVEYFAFEISKKKPDNPENEFDTFDYVFPSAVRVYKFDNKNWKSIAEVRVESFEELGELKLKTLKENNNID